MALIEKNVTTLTELKTLVNQGNKAAVIYDVSTGEPYALDLEVLIDIDASIQAMDASVGQVWSMAEDIAQQTVDEATALIEDYVEDASTSSAEAIAAAASFGSTHPETAFYSRWLADTGTQFDVDMAMQAYEKMKANDPNTVFVFMPHVASKIRTSGLNRYMNKMCSLKSAAYDAVQSVDAVQPFVGGYIAPNEKLCLKYMAGQTQTGLVDFLDKNYSATSSWTLTSRLKVNNKGTARIYLGSAYIQFSSTAVSLHNGSVEILSLTYNFDCGKVYTVSFQYDNGVGSIVINSVNYTVPAASASIIFGQISYNSSFKFDGSIYSLVLQDGRKSAAQSQLDHQILSTFFPDVETIGIGYQRWTTSNFDGIVAGDGTVIPEVQSAATAADATNIYNSVYAATSGSATVRDLAATKAAAMWCYYNNDPANGAVYGKLYNWYAVHLFDLYTPIKGWRIPSKADFDQLVANQGGSTVAGGKFKAKFGGFDNANATNEIGFSAVPGGRRSGVDGSFGLATTFFVAWSSDNSTATNGTEMEFVSYNTTSAVSQNPKISMYAIRLLANAPNVHDTSEIQTNWITTNFASGTANVDLTIPFGCIVDFVRVLSRTGITSMQGVLYTGAGVAKETLFSGATVVADTPIELNTRVNQSIQQTNGFVRFNGVKADTGGLMMIVVGLKRAYNTEML